MHPIIPLFAIIFLSLGSTLHAQSGLLSGTYYEASEGAETGTRIAHMRMDSIIELTIIRETHDEHTFQYLIGSSPEQLEDSLYMFRGDSSWMFGSVDWQSRMEQNPELYLAYMYDEEPMPDNAKRWQDSCAFHNPFADQGLLDAKIAVPAFDPFYFRPFVARLFNSFAIIPVDSGTSATYHFKDIEAIWWCENLPIPVPNVEQVILKLAITDPLNHLPITLPLHKGWKHGVGFGIADPRATGNNRVPLFIKILLDGRLQLSYQYPKEGFGYSIMAVFEK
ncbi:MAG: hypothetical protein AAFV07_19715 [Bacteroidota bacterium]